MGVVDGIGATLAGEEDSLGNRDSALMVVSVGSRCNLFWRLAPATIVLKN